MTGIVPLFGDLAHPSLGHAQRGRRSSHWEIAIVRKNYGRAKSSRRAHRGSEPVLYRIEMTTSMHFLPKAGLWISFKALQTARPARAGAMGTRDPAAGTVRTATAKNHRPSKGNTGETGAECRLLAAGCATPRAAGLTRRPPPARANSDPACAGCAARESSPWSRRCRACARSPCCSRRVQSRAAHLLRAATGG